MLNQFRMCYLLISQKLVLYYYYGDVFPEEVVIVRDHRICCPQRGFDFYLKSSRHAAQPKNVFMNISSSVV
ncbi:unnamed protein product [Caenorhabditis nigoni]